MSPVEPEIPEGAAYTAVKNVKVRNNPSDNANMQDVIREAGTTVEIVEREDNEGMSWCLIMYDGGIGYVHADDLRAAE